MAVARRPEWARPAAGGLLLGLLLLAVPQMYGVGYPELEQGDRGPRTWSGSARAAVGKILAPA